MVIRLACFLSLALTVRGKIPSSVVQRLLRFEGTNHANGEPTKISPLPKDLLIAAAGAGVATKNTGSGRRHLVDSWDVQPGCDTAFANDCISVPQCIACFGTLANRKIDWATLAPNTPCHEVVDFLFESDVCLEIMDDDNAIEHFCQTFDSCVIWDDANMAHNERNGEKTKDTKGDVVDCSTLTKCEWEGMNPDYIGDGVCHDTIGGCYNSKVCGYDGGDCCADTCRTLSHYKECGSDGFACRDPSSSRCDSTLTSKCPPQEQSKERPTESCGLGSVHYRLHMYDSFGDGWDTTRLILANREVPGEFLFNGGLENGFAGTKWLCLDARPTCYTVDISGGTWGNEVSWEIIPQRVGLPPVGGGGTPMKCQFPVHGHDCEKTCDGKANTEHIDDPEYTEFKQMEICMEEKCVIQISTCKKDSTCTPCLKEDVPEYCFSNENFNALVSCGICQCGDHNENSIYCQTDGGHLTPGVPPSKPIDEPGKARECSPRETMQGSTAVSNYAQCTDFEQVTLLMTEFDEQNFGTLDVFEKCAHTYKNDPFHGGFTALGCMKILHNAIDNPLTNDRNAPKEAISSLARLLYKDGESFCNCSKIASDNCPLCPSFKQFKTFLYESLDACLALDEIDCDAWYEFYQPCKDNLNSLFIRINFRDWEQCKFVQDNCGGAGTFPAFRRLDCGSELPREAWNFYNEFADGCLKNTESGDDSGRPLPTPPSSPPPKATLEPTTTRVVPVGTPPPTEIYKSAQEYDVASTRKKKKSGGVGFWITMVLFAGFGGVGYYVYKKRQDGFQFVRYRRAPRNFGDGIYSGLDMTTTSTFEPPSLPTPA